MEIKYLNQDEFGIDTNSFSAYLKKLEKATPVQEGLLNVVFVNDKYIRALNKAYRGKDKVTDVLSFPYYEGDLVGEVYLSVETAGRQAKGHKHTLADELIKLIVHGILHIHGFDHEEDEDYRKMFAVEKAVLGMLAGDLLLKA